MSVIYYQGYILKDKKAFLHIYMTLNSVSHIYNATDNKTTTATNAGSL